MFLNATSDVSINSGYYSSVSDTHVTVGNALNENSAEYVMYLFAHNDGDGEFGEDADQDIIKCGSYTGNGTSGNEITLGFEPQWVLVKAADDDPQWDNWFIYDSMRGMTDSQYNALAPNTSSAESVGSSFLLYPTATGFKLGGGNNNFPNNNNIDYIYIAIRRGPMKTPESGTEVFAMDQFGQTSPSPPAYNSPWPVDLGIQRDSVANDDWIWASRLASGNYLRSNATSAEVANSQYLMDFQNGFRDSSASLSTYYGWMFRRAPGFFDVVAYEGTGSVTTVSHNLGVAPELIIIKNRDSSTNWRVYTTGIDGTLDYLYLNLTNAKGNSGATLPTSSVFSIGTNSDQGASGNSYIAYLFATLPGVSKVGSYTGNGSSQTIDCGFSAGARFVLIKRTDSTGDWHVYDSERGIVAGNDPRLELNTVNAQDTGSDDIDPVSSGFAVTSNADVNTNNATYIFLAIA